MGQVFGSCGNSSVSGEERHLCKGIDADINKLLRTSQVMRTTRMTPAARQAGLAAMADILGDMEGKVDQLSDNIGEQAAAAHAQFEHGADRLASAHKKVSDTLERVAGTVDEDKVDALIQQYSNQHAANLARSIPKAPTGRPVRGGSPRTRKYYKHHRRRTKKHNRKKKSRKNKRKKRGHTRKRVAH